MSSNITLRLDQKTIARIRHLAVDKNTSVSAWVSELVTRTLNELDGFEPSRAQALEALAAPVRVADAATLSREAAHER